MYHYFLITYRWSDEVLWHLGSLVRHNQCLYKAEGMSNAAEPGNPADKTFYVSTHIIYTLTTIPLIKVNY